MSSLEVLDVVAERHVVGDCSGVDELLANLALVTTSTDVKRTVVTSKLGVDSLDVTRLLLASEGKDVLELPARGVQVVPVACGGTSGHEEVDRGSSAYTSRKSRALSRSVSHASREIAQESPNEGSQRSRGDVPSMPPQGTMQARPATLGFSLAT